MRTVPIISNTDAIVEEPNDNEEHDFNIGGSLGKQYSKEKQVSNQKKKFIESDFMNFEENQARGGSIDQRMTNTIGFPNNLKACCQKSQGNNYQTSTRRSKRFQS